MEKCSDVKGKPEIDFSKGNSKTIVTGYWIQKLEDKCECSNCGVLAFIALYPHGDKNFCPNCGAKMEGTKTDSSEKSKVKIRIVEKGRLKTSMAMSPSFYENIENQLRNHMGRKDIDK